MFNFLKGLNVYLMSYLLCSFDDIACLSNCDSLSDLTLDGNPLANQSDHRPSIIFHISLLRSLDQTVVSVSVYLYMSA